MIKALILSALLLQSCNSNDTVKKENLPIKKSVFFEDINLYTLEGVREITKSPTYPYIQVEYVGDKERNIIYHGSKEMNYHRDYKQINGSWNTSYATNGDTCTIITYEFILPSKIIDLYYCHNSNLKDTVLTDVVILEDSVETTFDMGNLPNVIPGINVVDLAVAKNRSIFTREISTKDNVLRITERLRTSTDKTLSGNTKCYELGNHTYFWWRNFGWTTKEIFCK